MGEFDLLKLYNALKRVLDEKTHKKLLEYHHENYWKCYKNHYYTKMAKKIGVLTYQDMSEANKLNFHEFVDDLFYGVMNYCRTDMTLMFKTLEKFDLSNKDQSKKTVSEEMSELSPNYQHYHSTLAFIPRSRL